MQGLLEGPAARVIQGLPLTEANYNVALNLLQGRFGNTQHIISMHMDEHLQLPTCSGNKSAELRLICDKVGVNVRGLESLEMTTDKYGSFLVPIIMSKLAPDVRLKIARVTTKDVWQIKEVLTVLKSEVQATEMSSKNKGSRYSTKTENAHNGCKDPGHVTLQKLIAQGGVAKYQITCFHRKR